MPQQQARWNVRRFEHHIADESDPKRISILRVAGQGASKLSAIEKHMARPVRKSVYSGGN
jgi:hypothetical protein